MMLCDIQDCGLITITNKKGADVTYYDYGIKIHEALHLLQNDDDLIWLNQYISIKK